METVDAKKELYEEVSLLGKSGLFTELRVDRETVPEGVYCYELRHGGDEDAPVSVEKHVRVNYFGAVLFTEPLKLGEGKALQLGCDDFAFTGDQTRLWQMLKNRMKGQGAEKGRQGETGPADGYEILATGEALTAFMDSYDMLFHMTEKEAEMLCGYMDRQGYVIGRKDGQLYRGEPQAETKGIAWEETTIDDLVDSACEWNYELLREAEAKMENPDYLTD